MEDPKETGRKKAEALLAAREKTYRLAGDKAWETPAGMHAVKLLGEQESITIDDIIASLQKEAAGSRELEVMNERVIAHLLDLQARRKSA